MNKEQNIIIYKTADGKASVSLYAKDGSIWMNQSQLAELFATSKQNIGQHIVSILNDNELEKNSVVKNYFTTASDGKEYNVDRILDFNDQKILKGVGSISSAEMEEKVREVYSSFDQKRKVYEAQQYDLADMEELAKLIDNG